MIDEMMAFARCSKGDRAYLRVPRIQTIADEAAISLSHSAPRRDWRIGRAMRVPRLYAKKIREATAEAAILRTGSRAGPRAGGRRLPRPGKIRRVLRHRFSWREVHASDGLL